MRVGCFEQAKAQVMGGVIVQVIKGMLSRENQILGICGGHRRRFHHNLQRKYRTADLAVYNQHELHIVESVERRIDVLFRLPNRSSPAMGAWPGRSKLFSTISVHQEAV